jgi:hypothetical protein
VFLLMICARQTPRSDFNFDIAGQSLGKQQRLFSLLLAMCSLAKLILMLAAHQCWYLWVPSSMKLSFQGPWLGHGRKDPWNLGSPANAHVFLASRSLMIPTSLANCGVAVWQSPMRFSILCSPLPLQYCIPRRGASTREVPQHGQASCQSVQESAEFNIGGALQPLPTRFLQG